MPQVDFGLNFACETLRLLTNWADLLNLSDINFHKFSCKMVFVYSLSNLVVPGADQEILKRVIDEEDSRLLLAF